MPLALTHPLQARAMAVWSVRMKALREQREREAARCDEDQDAVCCVCDAGDTANARDTIVFCERCNVAVHLSCYRIQVSARVVVDVVACGCGAGAAVTCACVAALRDAVRAWRPRVRCGGCRCPC
jgi:hypothetical protein